MEKHAIRFFHLESDKLALNENNERQGKLYKIQCARKARTNYKHKRWTRFRCRNDTQTREKNRKEKKLKNLFE